MEQLPAFALREMGLVEIESEWTARDLDLGGVGRPRPNIFCAQVSAQLQGANLGLPATTTCVASGD
jgi:hypothetical protein